MLNPIVNLQNRNMRSLGSIFHEAAYTLFQLLLLVLLILGIGGVAYSAISSDGWLLSLLKNAWKRDPVYALLTTCGVVLGISWLKGFFERRLEKINYIGDLLIYGWLVLGAYFATRLILTGSL